MGCFPLASPRLSRHQKASSAECASRRLEQVVEAVLEAPVLLLVIHESGRVARRREVVDQVGNDGLVCAVGALRDTLGT